LEFQTRNSRGRADSLAFICSYHSFYPAIREVLNQNQLAIKCREAEKSAYEALIAKLRDAIAILNEAQQLYAYHASD
jgi:hypothetical protein